MLQTIVTFGYFKIHVIEIRKYAFSGLVDFQIIVKGTEILYESCVSHLLLTEI